MAVGANCIPLRFWYSGICTLPCTEKITLLLPSRFIKALLPLLNDEDGGVDLCFSDRMILSSIDADMRVYVASTKLTGQFPNWEAVMPSGKRTEITVNAKEMLASLERPYTDMPR